MSEHKILKTLQNKQKSKKYMKRPYGPLAMVTGSFQWDFSYRHWQLFFEYCNNMK